MGRSSPATGYFFYGTLVDPDVRSAVLGAGLADARVDPDFLENWRTVFVRGKTYPVIVPAAGSRVAGAAVEIGDAELRRRLAEFEGPEYVLKPVTLASGRKSVVFAATPKCRPTARNWRLGDWQRRHKAAFLSGIAAGRLV